MSDDHLLLFFHPFHPKLNLFNAIDVLICKFFKYWMGYIWREYSNFGSYISSFFRNLLQLSARKQSCSGHKPHIKHLYFDILFQFSIWVFLNMTWITNKITKFIILSLIAKIFKYLTQNIYLRSVSKSLV